MTTARHFRWLARPAIPTDILILRRDLGLRQTMREVSRMNLWATRRLPPAPSCRAAAPDLSESLVAWQMREYQKSLPDHFRRFVLD